LPLPFKPKMRQARPRLPGQFLAIQQCYPLLSRGRIFRKNRPGAITISRHREKEREVFLGAKMGATPDGAMLVPS
jgi:hypothetical protein